MTVTDNTAPVTQPLDVPCGADWTVAVPFTDASGSPIPLQAPLIQVRSKQYSTGPLLLTPTATVGAQTNTVTVVFPGTVTAAVGVERGYYDLFATRVDTGELVKLLQGVVTFRQNVTALTP